MNIDKPKFIRAFWGDLSHHNNRHMFEIDRASKFDSLDEIVFVWGEENEKWIKSFGYKTILAHKNSFEFGKDFLIDSRTFFLHKLTAIYYGIKAYGKVIFLDWDIICLLYTSPSPRD